MIKQYIFGPVASRRLGISLGVDLVKSKICSLDCIYCEAGKTSNLTCCREEYVDVKEVCRQLDQVLASGPHLDYITFSGAGEPTLNSKIGEVVNYIKDHYPQYRLCLLTNGTLLYDRNLQDALNRIDLVIPSLDASNLSEFKIINRPAEQVDFDRYINGLIDFCQRTKSEVVLELFIVPNVNDSDESIQRFVEIIKKLKISKVQLNTLDRPGVLSSLKPADKPTIMRFCRAIEPIVPVEAVGVFRFKSQQLKQNIPLSEVDKIIIELCSRRPATLSDLTLAVGGAMDEKELKSCLERLLMSGILQSERQGRGDFFSVDKNQD